MLKNYKIEEEEDKMIFNPILNTHNSSNFLFDLEFEFADKMSFGETASLIVEIKEPSVFKSLKTLKGLNEINFEGPIPPLIPDHDAAKYFKWLAGIVVNFVESFIKGDFVILVVLGSAMQNFWGMIRAVQMITLSSTIRVTIPSLMMLYVTICVEFSKIDIFSGEDFYANNFVFKETAAPSE